MMKISKKLRFFKITYPLFFLFFVLVVQSPIPLQAKTQFITIGTGPITGVYYPTGGIICRLINRQKTRHNLWCNTQATMGSVYNIHTLRNKNLDFAFVQSDWHYFAYYGGGYFKKENRFLKLRSLFSLYPEPFTIVVRKDSGINKVEDLAGKRVNLGTPGSGHRGTMEVLMKVMNWKKSDFRLASELSIIEQNRALCDHRLEAIVFSSGHPNGAIKEAIKSCPSQVINVWNNKIANLVDKFEFYEESYIPGNMYGNLQGIKTFGVYATLVATREMPEKVAYEIVKGVFENFDSFRRTHPSYYNLKKEEMVSRKLHAPIHRGALRYYREIGLVE